MIPGIFFFFYQLFQWSAFVYNQIPPAPILAVSEPVYGERRITPIQLPTALPMIPTTIPTVLPTATINPTKLEENPAFIQPTLVAISPLPTATPKPQPTATPQPQPSPTLVPQPSTSGPLVPEVNSYRQSQGKSSLSAHSLLCSIAGSRLASLIQQNSLDNHQGIAVFQDQILKEFNQWWEVLFQASPPYSPQAVVNEGWANSPSHRDSILASEATHGCGAIEKGIAVFILGKSK
jgi:uncharacterized protein YkwD